MAVTSNLLLAVGTMDTTLTLSDTTNFSVDGGVVLIGTELISFSTATDRTLIGCVRGVQGTTAATHMAGTLVTQTEVFPFSYSAGTWTLTRMQMPELNLLDPTVVPTALQIEANAMIVVTLDGSGANQTWTLPTLQQPNCLELVIALKTPASFTLSVNTVSIAAGTGQTFMWSGSAWYSV